VTTRHICGTVLITLLAGCVDIPLDPVPPSWDVQVSVGLTQTTRTVRELVGDLALLPPEVLDTLDLSQITIHYEEDLRIADSPGQVGLTPDFFSSVSQAEIFVEAENGTPVLMSLSMELLDSAGALLIRIPESGSDLAVPAAPLDATGKVGSPTVSGTELALGDEAGTVFSNAARLTYSINLSFPPGVNASHVLGSDSLAITAWGSFVSRVEP